MPISPRPPSARKTSSSPPLPPPRSAVVLACHTEMLSYGSLPTSASVTSPYVKRRAMPTSSRKSRAPSVVEPDKRAGDRPAAGIDRQPFADRTGPCEPGRADGAKPAPSSHMISALSIAAASAASIAVAVDVHAVCGEAGRRAAEAVRHAGDVEADADDGARPGSRPPTGSRAGCRRAWPRRSGCRSAT